MEPNMSKQYVVSACLAGESCRYDGGCSPVSYKPLTLPTKRQVASTEVVGA